VTERGLAAGVRPYSPLAPAGLLVRGAVFAGSSVCLATAAHVAGGGARPAPLTLLCAWALLTRIGFGSSRRETGTARLTGAALGAQLTLHTTFCLLGNHTQSMMSPAVMTAGAVGPVPVGPVPVGPVPVGSGMAAMAPMGASFVPSVRMIAAHLLATLVVALLLRRAERIWFGVAAGRLAAMRHAAAIGARIRYRRALAGLTRARLAAWRARIEATARAGAHDVARDPRRWPQPPWREVPSTRVRRRGPPAPDRARITWLRFSTASAFAG
jgi:hypothetical protein